MKTGSGLTLALALYGAGMVLGGMPVTAQAQEQAAAVAAPQAESPEPLSAGGTGNPGGAHRALSRRTGRGDHGGLALSAADRRGAALSRPSREEAKTCKPKAEWDGSVVSLLNYPEIVTDDERRPRLDADAGRGHLATSRRTCSSRSSNCARRAVAQGVIKTDDKVTVVAAEGQRSSSSRRSRRSSTFRNTNRRCSMSPVMLRRPIAYYPDPLSALLRSDRAVLRRRRDRRRLGGRRRLGRLGRLGRQRLGQRHRHRLQQLLQQCRLQRQGQHQRRRLEERRSQQDQHRQEPVHQDRQQVRSRTT